MSKTYHIMYNELEDVYMLLQFAGPIIRNAVPIVVSSHPTRGAAEEALATRNRLLREAEYEEERQRLRAKFPGLYK